MILIPAIDIKDGKVVRLVQGRFDQVKVYSNDPVEVAKKWKDQGAQWLHIVDLDGAQTGKLKHLDIIKKIKEKVKISVQTGGGIRSQLVIRSVLDTSTRIERVIIGTRVIHYQKDSIQQDHRFLKRILKEWEERIAVSIDCSGGYVAYRGWTEITKIKGADLARKFAEYGLQTIIYTDITRDGTLQGPNFEGLTEILDAVNINVIASGGISSLKDVEKLVSVGREYKHLIGAITGKAIYEGKLDFEKAMKLCSQKE